VSGSARPSDSEVGALSGCIYAQTPAARHSPFCTGELRREIGKPSASAEYSDNFYRGISASVDDPEAAGYHFAEFAGGTFRYDATRFWKLSQALHGLDKPPNGQLGISGRVSGDVASDLYSSRTLSPIEKMWHLPPIAAHSDSQSD
jgi:hypothetical protein